jgi:hypothetical protein
MTNDTRELVPVGINWIYNDGGRKAAGYKGDTGDCVCRAIAIVTDTPYEAVYQMLIEYSKNERPRGGKKRSHPRTGVHMATIRKVMSALGWTWTPTMSIGSGTTVHVRADELPSTGRHLLSLSRHITALVDGVIHDTHDPSREGTRAVYGYWSKNADTSADAGFDKVLASA